MKSLRPIVFVLFVFIPLFCLPMTLLSEENTDSPNPVTELEFGSVEERRLLSELQQERQNLDLERKENAKQKDDLKRLEAEVDKKLEELQALRKSIEDMLTEKSLQERKRIQELAKMYERMAPENVANIFIRLDKDLTIAILARMKTRAAAEILDNMDRERAVELTAAFSKLRLRNMEEKDN